MPEVLAHIFLSFHPVHNITTEVKDVRGNRDLNTSDSHSITLALLQICITIYLHIVIP